MQEVNRLKSPADIGKELVRQKQELSKRREPLTLAKDATPEQVSEYRKAVGVPEQATVEAYGVKAPDGYAISEVEKGFLGDFVKEMHANHVPAGMVQKATEQFFKAQTANQQAEKRFDLDRQTEWQTALKDKLGKDYTPTLEAGREFLRQRFAEKPEMLQELVNARLPGGGRLGDNPAFIEMVADQALAAGFTDRIEASGLESGGKSLAAQQQELEALRTTDRARYNLPEMQSRLDKIIRLRLNRGEIDEHGNESRRRAS